MAHAIEHFAIFAITGFAFGLAYDRKPIGIMLVLVIFAGVIELAQLFVPGRHARLSDFIVDALAACVGAALASVTARTIPKFRNGAP
jgi:VanZ family protein